LENRTPFAVEPMFLADEEARPLLVPVIKATYSVQYGVQPLLAQEQLPVNISGEYWGDPDSSSYKYEPEAAFIKPATDIVLIGHAYAQKLGDKKVTVGLRVGPVNKVVRVVGDRYWVKKFGMVYSTKQESFERIPLVFERAFGGWDRSHPNPKRHSFEPRNPVG